MILFYGKDSGNIYGAIDGRVHDVKALNSFVRNSNITEDVGRYIIGWIIKDGEKLEYNLDKFEVLQRFEALTPESPLDYRIDVETGELVKKML